MEAGGSPSFVEAPYTLRGPIAAGNWTIVGDGVVAGDSVQSVQVRFEVRLRPQGRTDDGGDKVLVSAMNTFMRQSSAPFAAVPFATTLPGIAGAAVAGDSLVLRFTAVGGDPGAVFIPNGDGQNTFGNIPRIDLPVVAK